MNNKELVSRQFNHQETANVPYTLNFETPLRKKLDLVSPGWETSVHNAILMVGCFDTWDTLTPVGNGQLVDAYGSLWRQTEDISHLDVPILQVKNTDEYYFPQTEDFCQPSQLEEMRAAIEAAPEQYIVGNIGAGFYELTWRLLGVEETLVMMVTEPEVILHLFEELMQLLYSFVDIICTLPVDAVMVGDDWADQRGIMFGAKRWQKLIRPYYKKLYAYIHSKGKRTVTHSCGSVRPVIPDLIDIGLDVLESVQPEAQGMVPYELKREFGKDLCFWGGLGCQEAVTFFTPERLRDEIRRLKTEMTVGGGYVLSPSKTLNISVPIENAKVILDEFTNTNPR